MNNKLKRIILYTILFLGGVGIGALFFAGNAGEKDDHAGHDHGSEQDQGDKVWTCSMHPQVRKDEPGNCPICGMELIPMSDLSSGNTLADNEIELSQSAVALANIQTSEVRKQKATRQVRLNGTVKPDERRIAAQTSHFPGRIERLYVDVTGQSVRRGQPIAAIYSPEVITAQEELLEAIKYKDSNPGLVEAARKKLKQWKLHDSQINAILQSGEAKRELNILADYSGIVYDLNVAVGDHVREGSVLYKITRLDKVWVQFDAYAQDLPWIDIGDSVALEFRSMPGTTMTAPITFIDPVMNSQTRTSQVRVEVANTDLKLRPELFVNGVVQASMKEDKITVPKTAVLWTGPGAVVYVEKPQSDIPVFEMREVTLGPLAGHQYVIASGLEPGEKVVTHGTFKIDAAMQLNNKPSMMNPEGGKSAKAHDHGDMSEISGEKGDIQIKEVYQAYLELKDALVNSDGHQAMQAANKMKKAVQNTDTEQWNSSAITQHLTTIAGTHDLGKQRQALEPLSHQMATAIEQFGLPDTKVYKQYCPMALNDKGALWLSDSKEIRNPYFGEKMLKCGEVKKVIE